MQRSTGITLLVGSAVYLAGAFLPVSQKVFGALDDPGTMASAIADNESGWTTASALFAIGVLVAGAGLLMLARQATAESDATTMRTVGFVGGLAAVVGALAFAFTSYQLITGTPEEVAAALNDFDWSYVVYSLLTQIALMAVGYLLLRAGRRWLGWFLVVVGVATLLAYVALGNMPPGVYYAALAVAGITLAVARQPKSKAV